MNREIWLTSLSGYPVAWLRKNAAATTHATVAGKRRRSASGTVMASVHAAVAHSGGRAPAGL